MTKKKEHARSTCEWCGESLPPWSKANSRTCSKPCRQKLARFRVAPASSSASSPMSFAYADPPYPGFARSLYGCDEVDHEDLLVRLFVGHPQGWALSTHASSLIEVGGMARSMALGGMGGATVERLRVAIWHRGSRHGAASHRARNAWEPVIVYGGRPLELGARDVLDDVLVVSPRTAPRSVPGAVIGMKSAAFAEWIFRQLGAQRGDTFVDMFPGSGVVSRAWDLYQRDPADAVHFNSSRGSRLQETQR